MRVEEGDDYTGLVVYDEYKKVDPEMILIIQKAGGGKSLFSESVVEEYHDDGAIVISLTDFKDERELCYAMFEPQEKFHLDKLYYEGKKPSKKKVEMYHPFTFDIPKTNQPKTNYFTIPLKSLTRTELSFIAESPHDTDSVRLLMDAVSNLGNKENIFDMLHYIQKHAKTHRKKYFDKQIVESDEENFYLEAGQKGSIKNVSEIASWFRPFLKDYFLTPADFKLNLDVKKIFDNPDAYHCLVTNHITDEKMKYFAILCFYSEIMNNIQYAKRPVLFVIEEVAKMCPYNAQGFKSYMADYFRDNLITMRSKGRGCSAVMTSQIWFDIDDKIKEKATQMFFGNLKGVVDLDRIAKSLKYKSDIVERLRTLKRNRYMLVGEEDQDNFVAFFPSHCHAEPKYNFNEMYSKFYDTVKYGDLIKEVKEHLSLIEKEYKEKAKKEHEEKLKEAEDDYKKKSGALKAEQELSEMKEKYKEVKTSKREDKIQRVADILAKNPSASVREVADIAGMSKSSANEYIKIVKSKLPNVDSIKEESVSQVEIPAKFKEEVDLLDEEFEDEFDDIDEEDSDLPKIRKKDNSIKYEEMEK